VIDFEKIVGFDWDLGNGPKLAKHGVEPGEAEQIFFDYRFLVLQDLRHSSAEPRFHGLGRTIAGRLLHVTFTLRREETLVRVISARSVSRRERMRYEDES